MLLHSCQYGSYTFVAHLDRVAYARAVDDEVGEQTFHLLLAGCARSTGLNGAKHAIERFVEIGVLLGLLGYVLKQLARQNK